jgi:hypothetical protein
VSDLHRHMRASYFAVRCDFHVACGPECMVNMLTAQRAERAAYAKRIWLPNCGAGNANAMQAAGLCRTCCS